MNKSVILLLPFFSLVWSFEGITVFPLEYTMYSPPCGMLPSILSLSSHFSASFVRNSSSACNALSFSPLIESRRVLSPSVLLFTSLARASLRLSVSFMTYSEILSTSLRTSLILFPLVLISSVNLFSKLSVSALSTSSAFFLSSVSVSNALLTRLIRGVVFSSMLLNAC